MSQQSFSDYVGIDVAKDKLDVFIFNRRQFFTVKNNPCGIRELIKKLPKTPAILLEATGGYERLPANTLNSKGFSVCVINPRLIFHFRQSLNQLPKTDKIDAAVLARFAQERSDLRYGLYGPDQQRLLQLQKCRDQMKKTSQQEKNRLAQTVLQDARQVHVSIIKLLTKKIRVIETKIKEMIRNDSHYSAQYEYLCSIPGIAESVAMTLISSLPEMGKLKHKALQRLVGVAPLCNDSGQSKGKRYIQGGRQAVRDALYMSALVSVRHNPSIRSYYLRKVAEGKPKKCVLVACIAKIVRIINSVVRNQKPFCLPGEAA